jgi:hypothetical protein
MMMKINSHNRYISISSFEDFQLEKQRLILKGKLIEAKINMEIILIREVFSVSNLVMSFAKEFLLPRISGIIEDLLHSDENNKE